MITHNQNGSCYAALIHARVRATTRHNGAVVRYQISMNGLELCLFRFLNSCHWLLLLIHINECMNDA